MENQLGTPIHLKLTGAFFDKNGTLTFQMRSEGPSQQQLLLDTGAVEGRDHVYARPREVRCLGFSGQTIHVQTHDTSPNFIFLRWDIPTELEGCKFWVQINDKDGTLVDTTGDNVLNGNFVRVPIEHIQKFSGQELQFTVCYRKQGGSLQKLAYISFVIPPYVPGFEKIEETFEDTSDRQCSFEKSRFTLPPWTLFVGMIIGAVLIMYFVRKYGRA